MINVWVSRYAKQLVQLKQFLTECEYKPEYDNFPIRTIQTIFNGAEAEINKLQNEVEMLKKEVVKLKELKNKEE